MLWNLKKIQTNKKNSAKFEKIIFNLFTRYQHFLVKIEKLPLNPIRKSHFDFFYLCCEHLKNTVE